MKATLQKIDQFKVSRNGDVGYYRLKFVLEDGTFAMTDIVPTFRNYANWKNIIHIGVGVVITGFFMKGPQKIDADSPVTIIQYPDYEPPVDNTEETRQNPLF